MKNLTANSLKQKQPIQSQSFTSDSDENSYIQLPGPLIIKKLT